MALDFYRLDNNEHLYALGDREWHHLEDLFDRFHQWTGLRIDPYSDIKLTTDHCSTLLSIIDKYIAGTDLNIDKSKTTVVLGFRGLLQYFLQRGIDLQLRGD